MAGKAKDKTDRTEGDQPSEKSKAETKAEKKQKEPKTDSPKPSTSKSDDNVYTIGDSDAGKSAGETQNMQPMEHSDAARTGQSIQEQALAAALGEASTSGPAMPTKPALKKTKKKSWRQRRKERQQQLAAAQQPTPQSGTVAQNIQKKIEAAKKAHEAKYGKYTHPKEAARNKRAGGEQPIEGPGGTQLTFTDVVAAIERLEAKQREMYGSPPLPSSPVSSRAPSETGDEASSSKAFDEQSVATLSEVLSQISRRTHRKKGTEREAPPASTYERPPPLPYQQCDPDMVKAYETPEAYAYAQRYQIGPKKEHVRDVFGSNIPKELDPEYQKYQAWVDRERKKAGANIIGLNPEKYSAEARAKATQAIRDMSTRAALEEQQFGEHLSDEDEPPLEPYRPPAEVFRNAEFAEGPAVDRVSKELNAHYKTKFDHPDISVCRFLRHFLNSCEANGLCWQDQRMLLPRYLGSELYYYTANAVNTMDWPIFLYRLHGLCGGGASKAPHFRRQFRRFKYDPTQPAQPQMTKLYMAVAGGMPEMAKSPGQLDTFCREMVLLHLPPAIESKIRKFLRKYKARHGGRNPSLQRLTKELDETWYASTKEEKASAPIRKVATTIPEEKEESSEPPEGPKNLESDSSDEDVPKAETTKSIKQVASATKNYRRKDQDARDKEAAARAQQVQQMTNEMAAIRQVIQDQHTASMAALEASRRQLAQPKPDGHWPPPGHTLEIKTAMEKEWQRRIQDYANGTVSKPTEGAIYFPEQGGWMTVANFGPQYEEASRECNFEDAFVKRITLQHYPAPDEKAYTQDAKGKWAPLNQTAPRQLHPHAKIFVRDCANGSYVPAESVIQFFMGKCAACGMRGHQAHHKACPYLEHPNTWNFCTRCYMGFHPTSSCNIQDRFLRSGPPQ